MWFDGVWFDGLLQASKQFQNLYAMFIASDATQVEINPLAVGGVHTEPKPPATVMCVDAKLNFDDNAAFRQKDLFAQRDVTMEDPRDVAAEDAGLNYIGLDGNIGCLGACTATAMHSNGIAAAVVVGVVLLRLCECMYVCMCMRAFAASGVVWCVDFFFFLCFLCCILLAVVGGRGSSIDRGVSPMVVRLCGCAVVWLQ